MFHLRQFLLGRWESEDELSFRHSQDGQFGYVYLTTVWRVSAQVAEDWTWVSAVVTDEVEKDEERKWRRRAGIRPGMAIY